MSGTRTVSIRRYDKRDRVPQMQYIDWGLTAVKADLLKQRPANIAFDLADIYADLSRRGELAGYEVSTRFYEIGSIEGLRETEELFRKQSEAPIARNHNM